MDPDDSLAQLIFHELCHALVAGEHAFEREDWALCNLDGRDLIFEHACHRVQAALSGYSDRPLRLTSQMPDYGVIFSDGLEQDFLEFNSGMTAEVGVAARSGRLVQ